MGEIPSTENGAASIARRIVETVVNGAITSAKALALVQAPWLNWPVVKQVFDYLMGKISTALIKAMGDYSTFVIIDLQTSAQRDAYLRAMDALKAADAAGDPNAIDEALKEARARLGNLIRFDGSSSAR